MTNPAYEATNSDVRLIAEMKAAAEKATPGEWSLAYSEDGFDADDGLIMREVVGFLPIAKIEGASPDSGFDEAFQKEQQANAEFIHAAQPENVLTLIAALEQAQKSNEFLKGQLSEIANFNPDWDKLEASYESWREIAAELLVAKNRIAELEASPNGMMQLSNELAEMKRKCVELTVWYGAMPESNGKTNWTAILHRKGECLSTGITVDRSEYPDRVRYEADRMSHLIGELTEEPDILAYAANKHSGYTASKEHL